MKRLLAITSGFVVSLGMFGGGLVFATYLLAVEPVQKPRGDQNVAELWTQKPRTVDPIEQDFERIPAEPSSGTAVEPRSGTAVASIFDSSAQPQPSEPQLSTESGQTPPDPSTEMEAAMAETGIVIETGTTSDALAVDTIATGAIRTGAETTGSIVTMETETATGEAAPDQQLMPSDAEDRQQAPSGQMTAAHLQWCFDQYRSYRPETNSYTPYSGGQEPCVSPYSKGLTAAPQEAPQPVPDADAQLVAGNSPAVMQYASDNRQGDIYISYEHVQNCLSRYRSYRPEDNTYQPYGGGPRRQCQ